MFGSLKIKWNRYLERLASVNEKLYGDERLDCCSMNGPDPAAAQFKQPQPHNEKGNTNGQ